MSLENTPLTSGQSTPTPPKAPKRPYWTRKLIKRQREQIRENLCKRFAAAVDDNARDGFEDDLVIESHMEEGPRKNSDDSNGVQQSDKKEDNGPICQLDIGGDHYVVAKKYQDKLLVHIRVYKRDQNNKLYPTKQGIALDLERWVKVQEWYADDVDAAIRDYISGRDVDFSRHLGGNYYIAQWEKVKDSHIVIKDMLQEELEQVTFCDHADDHQNQMGMLRCSNCNPSGCHEY